MKAEILRKLLERESDDAEIMLVGPDGESGMLNHVQIAGRNGGYTILLSTEDPDEDHLPFVVAKADFSTAS